MQYPNFNEEKKLWKKGYKRVVGLDEAGRGPLAGPVVAVHEMNDVYPGKKAKFVKNFMPGAGSIQAAVEAYVNQVKAKTFPGPEHSF